jgi:hypothetical protein
MLAELMVGLPLVAAALYGAFFWMTVGRTQERFNRYCTTPMEQDREALARESPSATAWEDSRQAAKASAVQ